MDPLKITTLLLGTLIFFSILQSQENCPKNHGMWLRKPKNCRNDGHPKPRLLHSRSKGDRNWKSLHLLRGGLIPCNLSRLRLLGMDARKKNRRLNLVHFWHILQYLNGQLENARIWLGQDNASETQWNKRKTRPTSTIVHKKKETGGVHKYF